MTNSRVTLIAPTAERQAAIAIAALERIKPINANLRSSYLERLCNTSATWLMVAAGLVFLILCMTGVTLASQGTVHGLTRSLVLLLNAICMAIALLALGLEFVSALTSLLLYRRNAPRRRVLQFEHELTNAKALAAISSEALELADDWMAQKMKRIERRLSLFFGGADKIALFAIVGTCWVTGKELLASNAITVSEPILYSLAFLVGITLGGVSLRLVADRLAYQRDIIALAHKLRS